MTIEDRTPPVPIAIIGMGCLFPQADTLESYWANLQGGVDCITDIPPSHWRPEDYFDKDPKKPDHTYAARGGFLSPVDFPALELGISPNILEATDTTQLLGLLAARQAFESAGYGNGRAFDRSRVSVILGVTGTLELVVPLGARLGHPQWKRALKEAGVAEAVANDVVQKIADSYVGWQEDSFPGLLGNVVAGRIANRLDLGGTNCVVDAACASSLSALHLALLELTAGRSDMVLTGGMDTFNDIFMYMCFSKTPALSPSGEAKPFDASADGTILGEGLGCLLLKRLADAERDGDKIFAVIRSVGTSSDGRGQAIYAPSSKGQTKALRQAYSLAGVTPASIELVEAHGTGTKAGDAAEVAALAEVFGLDGVVHSEMMNGQADGTTHQAPLTTAPLTPWCALGSVKSQIGHTKAAAGVAGLIKAALGLYHKVLPPTIKVTQPLDQIATGQSPFYVNTEKRPWMPPRTGQPRRAAVSAFGFGGSNFHCVLEEYAVHKEAIDWDKNVQIFAISAETSQELHKRLAAWPQSVAWEDIRIEAARSRASFSTAHRCRLTIVLERDKKTAGELIASARARLEKSPEQDSWTAPDGIFFARGAVAGKLAMVFPGQGSQYVGMLRDLTCRWPQMQATLSEANALFASPALAPEERGWGETRLSDYIYPLPVFRDEARLRNDNELRATDIAQPALGALSLGALRVLEYFRVRPEAVAGHSYGELTALCAAGWLDNVALHTLSRLRGQLMAAGSGDRGSMLAVRAPLETVEAVIREECLDLVLANRNAPSQAVLSGSLSEIARAGDVFARRRIDSQPLPVAAAFHSPFVADACLPFQEALDNIPFHPTGIAVFANNTAREYPRTPQEIRGVLTDQLAQPVLFVEEIDNMHRAGVRTFLEVGPGNKLSGLVRAILEGRPHEVLTLDASSGKRSGLGDLARVLAQLAALGHAVELAHWDEGQADRATTAEKKPTLTVPICGANYVKPRDAKPLPHQDVIVNHTAKPDHSAPVSSNGAGHKRKNASPQPAAARSTNHTKPPSVPQPRNETASAISSPPAGSAPVPPALAMTQENLLSLQKIGEQTAQLHRLFLEGQDRALQVFQTLLDQQQRLLSGEQCDVVTRRQSEKVPEAGEDSVTLSPCHPVTPTVPTRAASPPVSPPQPIAAVSNGHLESTLLDVVAAKTGYPAEMLQLDMELDTDLGIDSIKRVEIFALLQEKLPEAPPVKADLMGSLRTLRQVMNFLGTAEKSRERSAESQEPELSGSRLSSLDSRHPSTDQAAAVFLDVVSQKTGYPPEMLQFDMELDTDLGIDSIKRVEIFSLLQEKLPEAPPVKAEHMGTLRTIRQVIEFLSKPSGNGTTPTEIAVNEFVGIRVAPGDKPNSGEFGYETHAPISKSSSPLPPKKQENGSSMGVVKRLMLRHAPLEETASRAAVPLPVNGEIWITAEDRELAGHVASRLSLMGYRPRLVTLKDLPSYATPLLLAGLVILAPPGQVGESFLFEVFQLMQKASAGLRESGKANDAVLTTVSRLDGAFGLSRSQPGADPVTGGLAGLTKTARHEWPEVHCKALDLAQDWEDPDAAAVAIVEEMLLSGPVEVGLSPQGRCALQLGPGPVDAKPGLAPLHQGDVVVITGGARGVTAETAVALALAFAPTLVLLGRSPAPSCEPAWLAPLTEECDINRALLTELNGQATPKEVSERTRRLVANRAMLRTIERIEKAGSQVIYRQVDVRDRRAVQAAIAEIRAELGPIKGLVHGAGVLADRLIQDKSAEQFTLVYETKVTGLQNLLEALQADDLRMLALFSSSTGRFGRTGQVDYAAANEVLNKLAQRAAHDRPGCRVVAFNWGPWDGGMVTSSLKKIFANEGVGVIPLRQGAEIFIREICQAPDQPVEVVVLAGESPRRDESLETRDESQSIPILDSALSTPGSPFADAVALTLDLTLDSLPVLKSHVIKGHPVVPMALIVEWLAHAALHANPGLTFHGFDDLRIFKGIILPEGQPLPLRVLTGKTMKRELLYRVPVEIRSKSHAGREDLHVRAEIVLAARLPQPQSANDEEFLAQTYQRPRSEIYGELLFHGPDLHGIEQVESCSEDGIVAHVASAPSPAAWIQQPLRSTWLANPLVLDSSFQMMILWTFEQYGAGSLPCAAGHYRQYRRSFPPEGVRVLARITQQNSRRALADLEFLDHAGKVVAHLTDYECVIDASLNQAFRWNHLGQAAPSSL